MLPSTRILFAYPKRKKDIYILFFGNKINIPGNKINITGNKINITGNKIYIPFFWEKYFVLFLFTSANSLRRFSS